MWIETQLLLGQPQAGLNFISEESEMWIETLKSLSAFNLSMYFISEESEMWIETFNILKNKEKRLISSLRNQRCGLKQGKLGKQATQAYFISEESEMWIETVIENKEVKKYFHFISEESEMWIETEEMGYYDDEEDFISEESEMWIETSMNCQSSRFFGISSLRNQRCGLKPISA